MHIFLKLDRICVHFFIFSILICLNILDIQAQDKRIIKEIDSTFIEILNTPNANSKVDTLIKLFSKGSKKGYLNPKVIEQAVSIGKELHYTEGIGKAYYKRAIAAKYAEDYYTAIKNHTLALPYLKRTTDTVAIIKCLNSLGVVYRKVNIIEKSFNHYFEAYKIAKKNNYTSSMAVSLNGIGNLFIDIKKYEIALHYFKKALNLEILNNNSRGLEHDYSNIGETYMFLHEYDSAHFYTQKAFELSLVNEKRTFKAGVYQHSLFGKIYQQEGNLQKSITHYKKALNVFKRINNKRYTANTLINIGSNELELGKVKNGLLHIQEGLNLAFKIGSKENIIDAYTKLAQYYSETGQYKQAVDKYIKLIEFKDEFLNEKFQKELINNYIAYDTYEKEEEIEQLEKQKLEKEHLAKINKKKLTYSIIIAIILLTFMIGIFLLYRKNTRLEIENLNKNIENYVLREKASYKKDYSLEQYIKSYNISERETDVLKLILEGCTNEEIAKKLYISKNTVKFHSKNIYSKLDVKNRIQVIQKLSNPTSYNDK